MQPHLSLDSSSHVFTRQVDYVEHPPHNCSTSDQSGFVIIRRCTTVFQRTINARDLGGHALYMLILRGLINSITKPSKYLARTRQLDRKRSTFLLLRKGFSSQNILVIWYQRGYKLSPNVRSWNSNLSAACMHAILNQQVPLKYTRYIMVCCSPGCSIHTISCMILVSFSNKSQEA